MLKPTKLTKRNQRASIVTRDIAEMIVPTGNVYESVAIISKRARQIASDVKEELSQKISEFAIAADSLEEIHENREQIEISKHYERLPKPASLAIEEFLDGELVFKRPQKDEEEDLY
ncbi:MAG: DNA-directed RNA polymerase subunit omega [Bernardetiaceae bacterium]|nr:DNA-directed RNA polymerase subunit omega [Bernardetiaceae bacterium]